MLKSFALRLLVASGCVIATQWPAWRVARQTRAEAVQADKFDVGMLPVQIGSWTGVDTELDERLVRNIGATSIVNRAYENGVGRRVMVHLASFSAAEMTLPHLPEKCYVGAGWKIAANPRQNTDGMPPHQAMFVEGEQGRAIVIYWYQVGEFIAGNRDELRQALQKLRMKRHHWPPLVKVLVHVPVEASEELVQEDVQALVAAIYRWVDEKS